MTELSPATLNEIFAIEDEVSFSRGAGGLLMVNVSNALATATIALQGAQLLSWKPAGEQAVIWLSTDARFARGASIRGGIPVCWPWFGPHAGDSDAPAHGFARTADWSLIEARRLDDGSSALVFLFDHPDSRSDQWPYESQLVMQMRIGRTLSLELTTRNPGRRAFRLGQALHSYFEISDISGVQVLGLDKHGFIDKLDGDSRHVQRGALTFEGETDRIYLDSGGECALVDPALGRRIRITGSGSRSTVVWNPWIEKSARLGDMGADGYRRMLCIETANAGDDVRELAPGSEHTLAVHYEVERLGEGA